MGRLNGGTTSKLRPTAPPSSLIGTRRVQRKVGPETTTTTSLKTSSKLGSHRWAKRKKLSSELDRPTFTPGREWQNAWASSTTAAASDQSSEFGNTTNLPGTFPLLRQKQSLSRKNQLPNVCRLRHPLRHPLPPTIPLSQRNKKSETKNVTMKRSRPQPRPQKSRANETAVPAPGAPAVPGAPGAPGAVPGGVRRGWTPPLNTNSSTDSLNLVAWEDPEVMAPSHGGGRSKIFGFQSNGRPPLPLHVLMLETTSMQIKDMEFIKNQLREIFIKIEKEEIKVLHLRKQLGPKKNPTRMTAQQR